MKRPTLRLSFIVLCALIVLAVGVGAVAAQSAPVVEITGVDASQLPNAVLTINVYDGQRNPITGLTQANFSLHGELASLAQIVSVQSVTDDNIPFSVVLVIDTSESMTGNPLARAKEAAQVFVQGLRPSDEVAILAFGDDPYLVQGYTNDPNLLTTAIDGLQAFGVTALYDAALEGVRLVAQANNSRRIVVLFSDGYEDRGSESATRQSAIEEAQALGVSVYTIGFGSVDASYLTELAESTSALVEITPNVDQIVTIFANLAARLRSQYLVTLNAPVPLDGRVYTFNLQADTPQGSGSASGELRAPIPVPIVRAINPPGEPIATPYTLEFEILADDALTSVTTQIGAGEVIPVSVEAPFSVTIDPAVLLPGDIPITVTAQDESGDVTGFTQPVTIAALPSLIEFFPPIGPELGQVSQPVEAMLIITGQTPPVEVSYSVSAENETPDLVPLDAPYVFTFDPFFLQPGANVVRARVVNAGGLVTEQTFPFIVAALAPSVTVEGLQDGNTLTEDRTITASVISQTLPVSIQYAIDGLNPVVILEPPYAYTIRVLDYTPGDHVLSVYAQNAAGESATYNIPFFISPDPAATATQASLITATEIANQTAVVVQATATQAAVLTLDAFNIASTATQSEVFAQNTSVASTDSASTSIAVTSTQGQIFAEGTSVASTSVASTDIAATSTQSEVFAQNTSVASTDIAATSTQSEVFAQNTSVASTDIAATSTQSEVLAQNTSVASTDIAATSTQSEVFAQNTSVASTDIAATSTQSEVFAQNTSVASTDMAATSTQSEVFAQNTSVASTDIAATSTQSEVFAQNTSVASTATQFQVFDQATSVAATATQTAINAQNTSVASTDIAATSTQTTVNALNTSIAATQAANQRTATQGAALVIAQQTLDARATERVYETATQAQQFTDVARITDMMDTQAAFAATATQVIQQATATAQTAAANLATQNAAGTQAALTQIANNVNSAQTQAAQTAFFQTLGANTLIAQTQAAQTQAAQTQAAQTAFFQTLGANTLIAQTQAAQTQAAQTQAAQTQAAQTAFFQTLGAQTQAALDVTATQVVIEATATAQTATANRATQDAAATQAAQTQLANATNAAQTASALANAARAAATDTGAAQTRVGEAATRTGAANTAVAATVTSAQATAYQEATALESAAIQSANIQATTDSQSTAAQEATRQTRADDSAVTRDARATNDAGTSAAQPTFDANQTALESTARAQNTLAAATVIAQQVGNAQRTAIAEDTSAAQSTQTAAITQTPIPTATVDAQTAVAQAVDATATPSRPTATPQGTLEPVEAPRDQPPAVNDSTVPILVGCGVLLVILLAVYLILTGQRRARGR